ncbi:hypothetical protein [Streptomyces sp. AP-93]|uniref:hypothetical protein n=1 Tax=Streptomyces sp. AP-93 TaxID=2929048 RepID=UPI001FAEB1D7|nr:hypothetical protein [Streptomyces sp. AP-93]MCJ0868102.1 hypothetical protein [Streptomyces sp. AP-93]
MLQNTDVVASYPETHGWHALFAPDGGGDDIILPVHAWDVRANSRRTAFVMDENHGPTAVNHLEGHTFRHFISAEDIEALEELPEVVPAVNPAFAR